MSRCEQCRSEDMCLHKQIKLTSIKIFIESFSCLKNEDLYDKYKDDAWCMLYFLLDNSMCYSYTFVFFLIFLFIKEIYKRKKIPLFKSRENWPKTCKSPYIPSISILYIKYLEAGPYKRLDNGVKTFIRDLVVENGASSERGETSCAPPCEGNCRKVNATDRKFCPTNKAIRNHMALANKVNGLDDQTSLCNHTYTTFIFQKQICIGIGIWVNKY